MKGSVKVFNNIFEYDFLSAWIKYNRITKGFSQEYVSHGICSPSHLSYFENGKKKLAPDLIERILSHMGIREIPSLNNIGSIRKTLINFISELEFRNHRNAKMLFEDIAKNKELIEISPYSIEYKIYELAYNIYIIKMPYSELKVSINNIDRVFQSLNNDLQYLFLLLTGRLYYKYLSHSEGISRLESAKKLKDTPWINYHLGFCYCYDKQSFRGIMAMNKALDSYQKSGQYPSAMYCNIYLGICYTDMSMYTEALQHLNAAHNAASNFDILSVSRQASLHISNIYLIKKDYDNAISWANKVISGDFSILAAINLALSFHAKKHHDKCHEVFTTFLANEYRSSVYYNFLRFKYLKLFKSDDSSFLHETIKSIIPYYEKINYSNICDIITLDLIDFYESKRKYKEANKLYIKLYRS